MIVPLLWIYRLLWPFIRGPFYLIVLSCTVCVLFDIKLNYVYNFMLIVFHCLTVNFTCTAFNKLELNCFKFSVAVSRDVG